MISLLISLRANRQKINGGKVFDSETHLHSEPHVVSVNDRLMLSSMKTEWSVSRRLMCVDQLLYTSVSQLFSVVARNSGSNFLS